MLDTNKFVIILKQKKCNNFFKQLIRENVKYTYFHYFMVF